MTTTTRLFVVASIVGLLAATIRLGPSVFKPEVELPAWDLADLPMQLGTWEGMDVELDERIREQLLADANAEVSRAYISEDDEPVSLHMAIFEDLDAGVRHSPINCYRGNGGRKIAEETIDLVLDDGSKIPVNLTTWEVSGQKILVMYWYQIGDHILFDRWNLFWSRLTMRRDGPWPAMVKVLLQTNVSDTDMESARERIQTVARHAHDWVEELQTEGSSAEGEIAQPESDDSGQTAAL